MRSILTFPRPQNRGPIEAQTSFVNMSNTELSRFRGLKTAAPLKRFVRGNLIFVKLPFPRPQNRGPIEADCHRFGPATLDSFRGLKTAAPLKLRVEGR